MKREYITTALFFLIVGIFFYLFYRLMVPFFSPIAWAGILVIVFYPLYKWLLKKVRHSWLASLISCILIFIIIIGPFIYLLASLVNEAATAVQKINTAYKSGGLKELMSFTSPFLDLIKEKLASYPQLANVDFESVVKDAVTSVTRAIGTHATGAIANLSLTLFNFFLMIFAMYYFFRDGERIINFMKRITPLETDKVSLMYSHLHDVIEGMMYGGVVMALIQGFLGGLLFTIVGISSPVLWGSVMAFLAFVPIVGPFLIYIPAGVILILGGSPVKGIIVIAIGTIVVSQLDNFVRPHLFSGKTQTHTLMLFFSIMGGVAFFGLLGIVLGPFIAAVFLSILKMFELQLHPEAETALILEAKGKKDAENNSN